jgi:hypothetical protein
MSQEVQQVMDWSGSASRGFALWRGRRFGLSLLVSPLLRHGERGSGLRALILESSTLPLSHAAAGAGFDAGPAALSWGGGLR